MDNPNEKKQSAAWQEPERKNNTEQRTFTEPDNPPKSKDKDKKEEVADEKKPTRQMTGGPGKPTA